MDTGAIGFFLFFVILIIIWIFAMGGCVRERKNLGVYEGLDGTKTVSFSFVNPAYPNACGNGTISNMSSGITIAQFNRNPIAQSYQASMDKSCATRGFNTKGVNTGEKKRTISGHTVKWDGIKWTK